MDKDMILRTIKSTWNVSLTVQLVPLTISIIIARLVHDNLPRISKPTALFYISFISAETYFAVTADAISELNLLNSELGQLTISTAVLHEILGWLNNALSPLVRGGFAAKFIKSEISFLAFLIFTFFVLRSAIQWIIRTTPDREPVKKCYIVAILIGALIMAGLLTDIFSIKDWKAFVSLGMILVAAYLGKPIDVQTFSTLVLFNLVLTAIVTPLISIFYKPRKRLDRISKIDNCIRTLQSTLPNSELRILCCIHHEDNVNGIINLLRASNPTEMNPICAYAVHLIDLVGRALPVIVPYNTQKRRLVANSTDRIMRAMTRYSKGSGAAVKVQPFKMISPYNTMHQSICKLVEDNLIPLVLLPFHENGEFQSRTACVQNFNKNVLSYAPCTVGIFVDRGLTYYHPSNICYNVAVFFLGGPDDREAMALVSRISSHPGMSITIFRIDLLENSVESENDRCLDDAVTKEFMVGNVGNTRVECHEMVANDSKQLMDAIKKEKDFELVIVGKRHTFSSTLEKEMKPWVEYEELGIIGDMLASADFAEGHMMSLLVIQSVESIKQGAKITATMSFKGELKRLLFNSSNCDKDYRRLDYGVV
ncbi:Cation/H(+) antiporter 15 [Citrus sinensis]|nr:Cation/H(+) antiporter 15 [Citrus sinensis]